MVAAPLARAYVANRREQVGSSLNISSYIIVDIGGDGIPLESPRRFMTRYSPCLAVGI
jgi:hypothetical protein